MSLPTRKTVARRKKPLTDLGVRSIALPPSLKHLMVITGLVASLGLPPALASAAGPTLNAGETLTWNSGTSYTVSGQASTLFTDATLDVSGTLSYSGVENSLVSVTSGSGTALNVNAGAAGLSFTHTSIDGSNAVIAINSTLSGLEVNYGGGAVTVEVDRSGTSIGGNFGAFFSKGNLSIDNTGIVAISGNFNVANTSGGASVSGNILGLQASNKITITGDVGLTDINRTATSRDGDATVNGQLQGVMASEIAAASVTVKDVLFSAKMESGTGNANASGYIYGLNSGTGTAGPTVVSGDVLLSNITRQAESAGGNAIAGNATGSIYGIGAGSRAEAGGTVTLTDIALIAQATGATGNAQAFSSNTIGVQSISYGGTAQAITSGIVTMSSLSRLAESVDDYARADMATVAGVYSSGSTAATSTAAALVVLEDISGTAISQGGYARADGTVYGVYADTTSSAAAVTISNITASAASEGSGTGHYARSDGDLAGVYAEDGDAEATGAINISTVNRSSDSQNGYARADGSNYGLYAGGEGSAASITISGLSHQAVTASISSTASQNNARADGGTYGLYAGADGMASGSITLDDVAREAVSAVGAANASGDNAGLYTGGEAEASTVKLSNLKNTATANGASGGDADASGLAAGVYSLGDAATVSGAVELNNIERRASSQAGDADASGGAFSGAYMVGNVGVHASDDVSVQAVTLSDLKNIAEALGGGFADASGITAGVYSSFGSATVNGAVSISRIERRASSQDGAADASDNDGNYNFFNMPGTYGVWALDSASAQAVTIDQVSTVAEAKSNADTSGTHAGVWVYGNAATAAGDITLSNLTRQAISAEGQADASGGYFLDNSWNFLMGGNYGLFAYNQAQAAGVIMNNVQTLAEVGAAGTSSSAASIAGFTAGVYSHTDAATAGGQVTLSDLTSTSINKGLGAAYTTGDLAGVSAAGQALGTGVSIQNVLYRAETSDSANTADVYALGFTAGLFSSLGKATASGNVILDNIVRQAVSQGGLASAISESSNYGDSYGGINGGNYGLFGQAEVSAQVVSLTGLKNTAETKAGSGEARAYGATAGVFSLDGAATAAGAIVLSGIERSAASFAGDALAGDTDLYYLSQPSYSANIVGGNYGLYAQDAAAATSVLLENISHKAVTTGAGQNAQASALTAGVYSADGTATVSGDVVLKNIGTSAQAAGTGTADARLYAYGIYGLQGLSTSGSVVVQAASSASSGSGATVWQLGQAVGLMSGGDIQVTGGTTQPTLISAEGSSQAFAISTTADPASSTTTSLDGLVYLRAQAGSYNNVYTSYNGAPIGGIVQAQKDARPVTEAEYLGLGVDDSLNINPGAGKVMNNGGEALRIFGAETVNVKSGALVLNADSWIVNQKDFNFTDTGDDYGKITGGARNTDLNVENGAALVVDGRVLSEVTSAMGAHNNGLFTDNGKFSLGTDYTLKAALKTGGAMEVTTDGRMSLTSLNQASGSDLIFGLTRLSNGSLSGGQLKVSGQTSLSGSVKADLSSSLIEGLLVGDLGQATSYSVIQAVSLNTSGAKLDAAKLLFYEYGFINQNNADLVFRLTRNQTSLGGAVKTGGGGINSVRAINTLMTQANAPYLPELMALVGALPVGGEGQMAYLAGQFHGEIAASRLEALLNYQKSQLDSLDFYLTGDFFQWRDDRLYGRGGYGYPSYGDCQDQPWRLRAAFNGGRAEQDANDGFRGYDVDNYTGLLALERFWDQAALGLSLSAGRSKIDFDQYSHKADSDNLNVNLYGRYNWGQTFLAGRLGYGHSSVDFERKLPTFGLRAKSDSDVDYFTAGLRAGYGFYLDSGWEITPSLGLSWIHGRLDGFQERGAGVYNLKYGSDSSDSFEIQADVGFKRDFGAISPRLNLGMAYEAGDTRHRLQTAFMELPGSPAFNSESDDRSRLRFMGDLGVKATLSENVSLSLDYLTSIQEDFQSHSGQLTLGIQW